MNEKEKIILELLGELHSQCKRNKIVYYLAESEKAGYTASVVMDAANLEKFIKTFEYDKEHRALEYRGNNYSLTDNNLRYINLDTLYFTEERLARDIHLGMFIKIKPMGKSNSVWNKFDRFRKHMGYAGKDRRSALINKVSGLMYSGTIKKSAGKLSAKDVVEIQIEGTPVYVKKGSAFVDAPEERFAKLIVKKGNNEVFVCDEEISYKDIDLTEDRKRLAAYQRKLRVPKVKSKRSGAKQSKCVAYSTASYARFCVATDLLQKYSYQEIVERCDEEPIRNALDIYIEKAKKVRSKQLSAYVGDEFTEVINKVYPEINTKDLYKYTPELYYEGIKVYDYKGSLIGVYGGKRNEQ